MMQKPGKGRFKQSRSEPRTANYQDRRSRLFDDPTLRLRTLSLHRLRPSGAPAGWGCTVRICAANRSIHFGRAFIIGATGPDSGKRIPIFTSSAAVTTLPVALPSNAAAKVAATPAEQILLLDTRYPPLANSSCSTFWY